MTTPLVIEPVVLPSPTPADVARRVLCALRAMTVHLAQAGLRGYPPGRAVAAAIRMTFDDLGGTFAKFGQLVASSPSVFGETAAHEFRASLDKAPPERFSNVRAVIEEDLRAPLESLYATFDTDSLAAASLAVLHRATLHDGTEVAVKVLRRDIDHRIATDLAVLRPLARLVAREIAVGGVISGIVDGLEAQITEELDLRNEARAARWFAAVLHVTGGEGLRVPTVHDSHSARRVLTMELLDGVPIDDTEAIAAGGIDPVPLVRGFIRSWLATTLCTGAFHGDVHAGNMLVCNDGTLALLDWGIVGRLDDATSRLFRRMIQGVLGDDGAWIDVATHLRLVSSPGVIDLLGLDEPQFVAFIRSQVEPFFQLPFGQLDLRTMLIGDGAVDGKSARTRTGAQAVRNWWHERKRHRARLASTDGGSGFDRSMFLLSKQLVYFERYGKLFLNDTPLLEDAGAFRALLDTSQPH